jgi:hypothetical protein
VLALTAAFALAFDVMRLGHRLGPLSPLMPNGRQYFVLAWRLTGLPLLIATVVGVAIACALVVAPVLLEDGDVVPWRALLASILTGASVAIAASLLCGGALLHRAHRWRG